ncbi:MAG: hypothetical protein CVV27_20965, partial [Candidatus Melainabacteria bacterium HGW-Melainabacteria-1]
LREAFFEQSDRYHMVSGSVLENSWLDQLQDWAAGRPVLFLAEGLLMYLSESEVRSLLTRLCERFPGAELVAEVSHSLIAEKLQSSRYLRWKFEHQLHLGPDAVFRSGVNDSQAFARWDPRLSLLGDWVYYDDQEPKLQLLNWMGAVPFLRHIQWVVHYRLGTKPAES